MTTSQPHSILPVLLGVAVRLCHANGGWLISRSEEGLVRSASTPVLLKGGLPDDHGLAGLALATGQPVALSEASGEASVQRAAALLGLPGAASVLCVPCAASDGDVVGAFELFSDQPRQFGVDSIELLSELARIGGSVLESMGSAPSDVPTPAELAASLETLASDPLRYAWAATIIDAVIDRA